MRTFAAYALALGVITASTAAAARDIPAAGVTVAEFADWMQSEGFQAKIVAEKDGQMTLTSASDGITFHVGFYDCKNERCGSIQFYAGFDKHSTLDATKMNQWDRTERWGRAYIDASNDPWIEMDVDLTPGGTYELLDDEFGIFRRMLGNFKTYIGA